MKLVSRIALPSQTSSFQQQQQNYEKCKEKEIVTHTCGAEGGVGEGEATETAYEQAQIMGLATKDLAAAIIDIVKEPKKVMIKEVKDYMMTISHQVEDINR